jgi:hypothetical protein
MRTKDEVLSILSAATYVWSDQNHVEFLVNPVLPLRGEVESAPEGTTLEVSATVDTFTLDVGGAIKKVSLSYPSDAAAFPEWYSEEYRKALPL